MTKPPVIYYAVLRERGEHWNSGLPMRGSPSHLVNLPACYTRVGESRKNFSTIGEEAVSHSETRLGGMEDSETEEVELSPSIHLPFQTFEPIDLAFDLPL